MAFNFSFFCTGILTFCVSKFSYMTKIYSTALANIAQPHVEN